MKKTRIEKIKRKTKIKQSCPTINLDNNYLSMILYVNKEDLKSSNSTLSLYYQNNIFTTYGTRTSSRFIPFENHKLRISSFPQISSNQIYIPTLNRNRLESLREKNLEEFVGPGGMELKIPNERIRLIYIPIFACLFYYFSFFNVQEEYKELTPKTQRKQLKFFKEVRKQNHPIIFVSVDSQRISKNKTPIHSGQKLAEMMIQIGEKYTLDDTIFSNLLKRHKEVAICYVLNTTSERKKNITVYNN